MGITSMAYITLQVEFTYWYPSAPDLEGRSRSHTLHVIHGPERRILQVFDHRLDDVFRYTAICCAQYLNPGNFSSPCVNDYLNQPSTQLANPRTVMSVSGYDRVYYDARGTVR